MLIKTKDQFHEYNYLALAMIIFFIGRALCQVSDFVLGRPFQLPKTVPLLGLPTNIRLGWKSLPGTNTQAHYLSRPSSAQYLSEQKMFNVEVRRGRSEAEMRRGRNGAIKYVVKS
jgi:hypothetical protein